MSGHSKWATIKHKKGAADAKRGKLFSKLIKEITVAARIGGSDINGNARLRTVVDKARTSNMPNDNIQRAIKKGTGELAGIEYEEIVFEGYGPSGVAILVETLTDNRNRTVAEMRHLFSKMGGNLGESGCVAWMFKKQGVLTFNKGNLDEEALMNIALEAGAEDIIDEDDLLSVITDPITFEKIRETCIANNLKPDEASIQMVPQSTVKLDRNAAEKMLKLMDALEDHDDSQNVYANFDIDSKLIEELAS
ncbi:MAG: YebC/PmpR family DNA-binding transcriptional regulator [Deltaproteobacteria bacterium CG07_land_8_20_14_0_80_38_7]|nr:MAG: YebC/PmpR family DNA-binding transcriptional regulator [Deltaproteobacteria bacterium CG07_land_8_20_14_0_80_38_7]